MIRAAREEDGTQVYALICALEQTALPPEPFAAIYQEQLAAPGFCCLVWEDGGAVTGVLNLRMERQLHHAARIAEVLELVVAPSCRGQGIGKALLARACETARAEGCVQLELSTNCLRTGAHRFYEREGMRCFHKKFTLPLTGDAPAENTIGGA